MSRRRKPRKSRKKLVYGIIVVILILAVCFLAYSFLHSSPPQVAIVDHLSFFPEQRNQTFVDASISILEEGGLTWAYYNGTKVTVNFYRKLPSYGTSLIILRVHSAIMSVEGTEIPILGLFTSELYSDHKAATTYREDVLHDRLVRAFFEPGGTEYFGIVPSFINESMEGKFKDTVIIMMGCRGLGYEGQEYSDMAEAFVQKGAKVCIGWDELVSLNHTDLATVQLLQSLISDKRTIKEAVDQTNYDVGKDPTYNSTLKYYPPNTPEVENYIILNLKGTLTMNVAYPPPTVPTKSKYKARE